MLFRSPSDSRDMPATLRELHGSYRSGERGDSVPAQVDVEVNDSKSSRTLAAVGTRPDRTTFFGVNEAANQGTSGWRGSIVTEVGVDAHGRPRAVSQLGFCL